MVVRRVSLLPALTHSLADLKLSAEKGLEDGQLRWRYRIGFERRTIEFVARTDADGRFLELQPLSGDDA